MQTLEELKYREEKSLRGMSPCFTLEEAKQLLRKEGFLSKRSDDTH